MNGKKRIAIKEGLYMKLEQISEAIGLSMEKMIEIQIRDFLKSLRSDPPSELGNLNVGKTVQRAISETDNKYSEKNIDELIAIYKANKRELMKIDKEIKDIKSRMRDSNERKGPKD